MTGRFAPFKRVLVALFALAIANAAHAAADPAKVYRIAFPTGETGFDPCKVSDLYSNVVNEAIFERLLTYDYLARPAKLVPMTAEAMPEVTDNGRTYTFHLRKGIYFAPDPAFNGKPRELVAQDYVYTFERFVDPRNRSPWAYMFEGRIEGLDPLIEAAKKTGTFDYDAKVSGLVALDRYTLRVRLSRPDYLFPYTAAHVPMGAVAREVIEKYANDTMAHPVGTGPYVLKHWERGARIVLEANPGYRGFTWDFTGSDSPEDVAIVKEMKGKRMPQIGRVEITIIDEDQSRWLSFRQKQLDVLNVPSPFIRQALTADNELKHDLSKEGIRLERSNDLDLTYTTFNFRDPIVGGYTPDKIALRRAIIMGYREEEEIRIVRKGQMVEDQMPLPPGVLGYDPNYRAVDHYDPATANKLLDYYGYKRGADGYRTLPNGSPLVLEYATGATSIERDFSELWKKSMDDLGLHIDFVIGKFADHLKAAKACHLMMWGAAWIADYPDGEDFTQLLYGPNTGQSNNGCYQSPAFDALYEAASKLPLESPERMKRFIDMSRQMQVDGAWQVSGSRARNELIRPWVLGFKKHPILQSEWIYMDIAPHT